MISVHRLLPSKHPSTFLAKVCVVAASLAAFPACAETEAHPTTGATMSTTEANSAFSPAGDHATNTDLLAATALMAAYVRNLNESNSEAVVGLYAPDAVYMEEYSNAVIGTEQIRKSYRNLFEHVTLHAALIVDEVVQVAPDWIFTRCHSTGTRSLKDTGRALPLIANQELFLLHRVDGAWKIARYAFSSRVRPGDMDP